MNDKNISVAKILTYMGVLPFLFLGFTKTIQVSIFDTTMLLPTYGAVIISFICGIHWAAFLFFSEKCTHHLLIQSNVITLLGWVSILPAVSYFTEILQILCFIYLLLLDFELYKNQVIPSWFFKLRTRVTLLVVLALVITIGVLK